ncbi:hypothetical protein LSTR_LSTR003497 [Laodelphax striatellus]|uniref:CID domain-containing protein n=1 Tax=Laodelphax striatellus TaxID=195883 RepID=A0A482WZS3_LAOST|nr:hypothetical protein LSTR_LSTR003497 [Laodelphax striatellus]
MVSKGGSSASSSSSYSGASYTIEEPDPPLSGKEVDAMKEYASSLEDLLFNSKPLINMLTMLAEENRGCARAIVLAIEHHLRKVPSEVKLPVLYLIDSIYKNVGSPYNTLFNQNIVQMFCSVFEKGDERMRIQLFKLRQTWNQMLPVQKLYALDVHVHNFDPAWPVQQLATMIHVNPKFLPPHVQGTTTESTTPTTGTPPAVATAAPLATTAATTSAAAEDSKLATLRDLRRKQKKLLELRQKKLELELIQTKEKLREQEMLQQQQLITTTTTADHKKPKRSSSKHSISSGSSSKSSSSSGSDLEKQRVRLSQQLKQELAQARQAAPVTLKTSTVATTLATTTLPLPATVMHAASTTTAKVTPAASIDASHHTPTSLQPPTAYLSSATGMPAVSGTAPVMRIAPVSSQLLSAVKRGATRDPRLLRAAQATTADSTKPPVVTSSPKTTSVTSSLTKTTSVTSSLPKTTSVTSSSTKTTSVTSSLSKTTSVTSSSKPTLTSSSKTNSVTSPKSSSVKSVSSSPSKHSSKSSSVTSKTSGVTSSADELSKKSRTSGGGGNSQSQSSSVSQQQPPITVSVPCSVATADVVVVKSSSRSSKSSSRSSAETAVASSKHHHHHHHHKHHQEPAAKMIDTVTEKDSLDLDGKEPADQSQPSTELATPPTEQRIGQLPEPVVQTPPTSGAKRLSEERDVPPPTKKSKVMERFDELFGEPAGGGEKAEEEMPPAPPPPSITPPPPLITEAELKSPPRLPTADTQMTPLAETDDTSRASGGGKWSKFKAHRQTSLTEPYSTPRAKSKERGNKDTDRLGRPLLYKHGAKDRRNSLRAGGAVLGHLAEQDEYDSGGGGGSEGDSSPPRLLEGRAAELVGGGCSYILQQAEEQFKNGSLSSTQYNQILKEMIELNELKKLDEARRKEEREHRRSRRKYRHHQKVSEQSEDNVQPAPQPTEAQNKEPGTETQKEEDHTVNGDDKAVNDMEISPDEDSQSIKSGKDSEKLKLEAKDANVVYEPLQPPPMPPAFVSRRSSEEEETAAEVKQEEVNDVDIRVKDEVVSGGEDVKKETVLPTKQDVDNRLGFPAIGGLTTPQVDTSAALIVKEPQFPPVINSTKDIDLRIGLHRPLVIAPTPMETEVVESANPVPIPAARNSVAPRPEKGVVPAPPMPPGPWVGPQAGAPWMMQGPMQCWGGPRGPMPPVMPLRPPPIPPQVMFEPDSNARLETAVVELPAADLGVLESIADDTMKSINIDGTPRDIRFYGDKAVVFLAWDDPREILFQDPQPHRKLIVDDRLTVSLAFHAPYQHIVIDGHTYPVRLGGPTRELYVGSQFYQILFGGPPISVPLGAGDRLHKLQLEGPPPNVRIGRPRRDLCLGKITLIVDARHHYTLYLDPKPQRFDLDGVPHIIRFVQALETTVINGVPFKFEFGGLPRPIYSRGKKHYVRLTNLPQGVVPGYVDIFGMEGGRRGDLVPHNPRPIHQVRTGGLPPHLIGDPNSQGSDGGQRTPPNGDSPRQDFLHDDRSMPMVDSEAAMMEAPSTSQFRKHPSPVKANPLDVLSTLLTPAATAPVSGFSYSLEKESTSSSSYQPALSTSQQANKPKTSAPSSGGNLLGDLNIQQLFEKLVATGIVPTANKTSSSEGIANQRAASPNQPDQSEASIDDDQSHIDTSHASDKIEFVDFGKPQTLRVRQPGLIKQLYTGIQCSSCGVRFAPEQTIKYSQHLDWHFRQNRRERDSARMVHSRTWYYDLSDWTQFEEIEDIEERALSWFDTQTLGDGEGMEGGEARGDDGGAAEEDVPSAACEGGAVDVRCALCRDPFDIFYNEDKEEWHLRRALKQDNQYYHPLCWDDHLASMETPPPEPEEVEKQEPITSITIDEDDSEEGNKIKDEENDDKKEGVKKEEEEEEEEDDDVIIQEPEHKMEIIELLKDDDEEEEEERNRMKEEGDESCSKLSSDKKDSEDGDSLKPTDFHSILRNIKKEKIDVDALPDPEGSEEVIDLDLAGRREEDDEQPLINQPPPVVDTTQVKVACSIDGNVELVDSGAANMLGAPSKIKINISKVIVPAAAPAPAPPQSADQSAVAVASPPSVVAEEQEAPPTVLRAPPTVLRAPPIVVESSEPPPPGEEPLPLNVKPRLIGHKLTALEPVARGTELSGLCSIM